MPPVVAALGAVAGVVGISSTELVVGVLSIGAKVGLSYYEQKKAKKAARRANAGASVQTNIRQDVLPAYVGLGRARVAGGMLFWGTANKSLYSATLISAGLIDKIHKFYLDDIECLVDSAGVVTTAPFSNPSGQLVKFEVKYGYTDQTASSILTAAFPGIVTADARGRGLAYLVTELKSPPANEYQNIYAGHEPTRSVVADFSLVYDPRDATQDAAREATWKFSMNPALILLHYFTSTQGYGLSKSLFDRDSFVAVADYCDELIPDKNGLMRPRFEMGGIYSTEDEPADIVDMISDTFGGQIYITSKGFFGLACDGLDKPQVTITQDMIVAMQAKKGAGALYEATTIKSTYSSELHGHKLNVVSAKPWVDAVAKARARRDISYDFPLPYVFRHDQARRLMKRKYYAMNPDWTVRFETDFNGLELYGERLFTLVYPRYKINGTFRIDSVEPSGEGGLERVVVTATSVSPLADAWDPLTEEGDTPPVAVPTEESIIPTAPSNIAALVSAAGTNALISWDAQTTGKAQEFEYKLTSGSTWTPVAVSAEARHVMLSSLTPAAGYDVRVRVTSTKYGATSWTSLSFTSSGTTGSTAVLNALSAIGGVGKIYVSAVQSSAAKAAYVQFIQVANGAPQDWTSPTSVLAHAAANASAELVSVAGVRDVYARSFGINNDTGPVMGPFTITVTATVVNSGSSGSSSGTSTGAGSGGSNDGGGSMVQSQTVATYSSNSYDNAFGGAGSGSGGGSGGIY